MCPYMYTGDPRIINTNTRRKDKEWPDPDIYQVLCRCMNIVYVCACVLVCMFLCVRVCVCACEYRCA